MAIPYISKRFAMERFLGLTKEEIAQNATQWKEENVDEDQYLSASSELRSAGITANGMAADADALRLILGSSLHTPLVCMLLMILPLMCPSSSSSSPLPS